MQNVLGGLILAGILWLAKSLNEHGKELTQIRTLLTGVNGDNGINSEVKSLRGDLTALARSHDLMEQRVGQLEERPA